MFEGHSYIEGHRFSSSHVGVHSRHIEGHSSSLGHIEGVSAGTKKKRKEIRLHGFIDVPSFEAAIARITAVS